MQLHFTAGCVCRFIPFVEPFSDVSKNNNEKVELYDIGQSRVVVTKATSFGVGLQLAWNFMLWILSRSENWFARREEKCNSGVN